MKQDIITDPPDIKKLINEYYNKLYTYIFESLHWTSFLKKKLPKLVQYKIEYLNAL